MKDQIDALDMTMKDRTSEIRELTKYVKRMEQALIAELVKQLNTSYQRMDYHVADIKDLIQSRMNIIGSKLVKNNKVIADNKESGNTEKFEI